MSSRQSLTPEKEELNRREIELVELKKRLRQKKMALQKLCEKHLEVRQIYIDVLDLSIPSPAFDQAFESLAIWFSTETIGLREVKREMEQLANNYQQKQLCYDRLYKEYRDKLEAHASVFVLLGMTIAEMAARLGDLVPNHDKISFFSELALPERLDQAQEG